MNPKNYRICKMNTYCGSRALLRPMLTTSWDDGHICDIKLANLLYKYRVPGTFYPVLKSDTFKPVGRKEIRELAEIFEIGCHTSTHRILCNVSKEILREELYRNKSELEDLIGKRIDMFCYPWGKYNSNFRREIIAAGFLGARTTKRYCLHPGSDPWAMSTTLMAVPFSPIGRIKHVLRRGNVGGAWELLKVGFSASWTQVGRHYFQKLLKDSGVFHLWGHSWEIEKNGLWKDLGDLLEAISSRSDVEYVTNSKLVERFYGSTLFRNHP